MDNQPEDDGPMYIPARRNYEIVRYVPERHHMEWWQILLILLGALLSFWLIRALIIGYEIRHVTQQLDKSLGIKPGALVRPYVPPAPVLVGPYQLPLSSTYRLQGKVRTVDSVDYMATSSQGSYIMIPAKDCRIVNGGPYCEYHGATVTRSSGG